jgi:hypothetical protein
MEPQNSYTFDVAGVDRRINAAQCSVDFLDIVMEQLKLACFVAERVKFSSDSYMSARYQADVFAPTSWHDQLFQAFDKLRACAALVQSFDFFHCSKAEFELYSELKKDSFFTGAQGTVEHWCVLAQRWALYLRECNLIDQDRYDWLCDYWRDRQGRGYRAPIEERSLLPHRRIDGRQKWLYHLTRWGQRIPAVVDEGNLFKQAGTLAACLALLNHFSSDIGGVSPLLAPVGAAASSSSSSSASGGASSEADVRALLHENNHALFTVIALLHRRSLKKCVQDKAWERSDMPEGCYCALVKSRRNGGAAVESFGESLRLPFLLGCHYERLYRWHFLDSRGELVQPEDGYREQLIHDFGIYDYVELNPLPSSWRWADDTEKEERSADAERSSDSEK